MTPARLAEIEALAAAATPGHWDHNGRGDVWPQDGYQVGDPDAPDTRLLQTTARDAAFIAAARQAVPEMAEALREAWAEIEALNQATRIALRDRDALRADLGKLRCALDKQGTEDSLLDAVAELRAEIAALKKGVGTTSFKKGDKVVKVLSVMGVRTATVSNVVASVKKGVVTLVDSSLEFDASTGQERNPAIHGCSSFIVPLDDGEAVYVVEPA